MAISLTLNFDDTWAARLQPMVEEALDKAQRNPVIVSLIENSPVNSVDELTPKQKAKLWITFTLLCQLARFEGHAAGMTAQQSTVADVEENFPLEYGD
jgi:hypothetical protein